MIYENTSGQGTQKIAVNHGFKIRSEEFQFMNKDIWSLGVVKGLTVTKIDDAHVSISPGVVVLKDYSGDHPDIVVKVELTDTINLTVDNSDGTHYVAVRYSYDTSDNPTAVFYDTTDVPDATHNYIKLAEYVAAAGLINIVADSGYYANVLDDGSRNTTVWGVLEVKNNVGIDGNLNVHGHIENGNGGGVNINDSLNVTGNVDIDGNLNVGIGLVVQDNVHAHSNLYVYNDLDVKGSIWNDTGPLQLSGDVSVGSKLTVNGSLDVKGAIYNSNSDVHISDNLNITGYIYNSSSTVTINDSLHIVSNCTITGTTQQTGLFTAHNNIKSLCPTHSDSYILLDETTTAVGEYRPAIRFHDDEGGSNSDTYIFVKDGHLYYYGANGTIQLDT